MENSDEIKNTHPQNLKHLGFVRAVAINTIVWLSNVYDQAKKSSGPLRSAIGTVEKAATTVITPVYSKVKGVPDHFLVFLDQKVDMASVKFEEHAPPLAKQAAAQVNCLVQKTAQVTKELIHQAQVGGPIEAACYAVNESKEVVLHQSANLWYKLDQLPPFHAVTKMTVPTAAHFSERYNKLISDLRGKGYTVFSYVPLVPIEEIAKAFKQAKGVNAGESPAVEVASQ